MQQGACCVRPYREFSMEFEDDAFIWIDYCTAPPRRWRVGECLRRLAIAR
jgi:hypothetical protein